MQKFLKYIIMLLIVLSSNTVYSVMPGVKNKLLIVVILLLITYLYLQISSKNDKVKKSLLLPIIVMGLILPTYILVHSSMWNMSTLVSFVAIFIIESLFLVIFSLSADRDWLKILVNLISSYAFLSFIFYILGTLLNLISATGTVTLLWGASRNITSYFNLYFETQNIYFLGYNMPRNSGFFVEAPVFGLVLALAVSVEVLILNKAFSKRIALLLITLATTFSLSGFLIVFVTYVLFFFKSTSYKENGSLIRILTIISFIFVAIITLIFIIIPAFNEKLNTTSGSLRLDDFTAGFKSWRLHPLVGNGLNNIEVISRFMESPQRFTYVNGQPFYNAGLANSITPIISDGGILLSLLYFLPLVLGLKEKKFRSFTIVLIMSLFIAIYQYTPILIMFLALIQSRQVGRINVE
ncbi:hypothetical protein [Leuconostoc mesenteroides]|uniref:hypothetical protein n=1 Tax=Leuconostoc mesenteroides TaxID=1245 RepID=UPI0032DF0EF2